MELLDGSSSEVAARLLGCEFEREMGGRTVRVRIFETAAYDQTDAASHSYRGRTPRTDVMFGPAGHLYVYFTYGMHYCMNVVCGPEGLGSAVLIRAVEPLSGEDILQQNRNGKGGIDLTNGPAKLCQALGIDRSWNGHDLRKPPLKLIINSPVPEADIVQTIRIGITQAKDVPWRFCLRDNPFVSK